MKNIPVILGTALVSLLLGCTSTPVALAPVGPNPAGPLNMATTGRLEVFSAQHTCRDGNEFDPSPSWYQHTDYTVYNLNGKRVRHVFNSVGHYEEAPAVITVPPGRYLVSARAQGYLRVKVPVVIESGRTTRVHLDAKWNPPAGTPKAELVEVPGGYPVGWRTDAERNVGLN
jgi:hypothetical protein